MVCNIGMIDLPLLDKEYSTLGGISSNCFLLIIPSKINPFKEVANTASVILVISFLISLYLNISFFAKTHIIRDFYFPPNMESPYSNGQRISFSNLCSYIILSLL